MDSTTTAHTTSPRRVWRYYRRYVRARWPLYGTGIGIMAITNLAEVFLPKFVQWTLDLLAAAPGTASWPVPALFRAEDKISTLHALMAGLLACLFILLLGRVGWRQTLARATHNAGALMKMRFWDTLRGLSPTAFQRYRFGDLMSRATADWNHARVIFGFTVVVSCDVIFFLGFGAVSMFMIDWRTSLAWFCVIPLLPFFMKRLTQREYAEHAAAQHTLGHLSELVAHSVHSARLQRATHTEQAWLDRLAPVADRYAAERFRSLRTGLRLFPLATFPSFLAYLVLLSYGLYRVMTGQLSVGGFVALQSYVVLLQSPLFEVSQVITEWQRGLASLGRVMAIIEPDDTDARTSKDPVAPSNGTSLPSPVVPPSQLALFAHQLRVGYGNRDVLRHISLAVRRGEWVGILGEIGSGKTTLLESLCGLLPLRDGHLIIDGKEVDGRDFVHAAYLTTQHAYVFSGSLRENLLLNHTTSDEHIWNVLTQVDLAEDVRRFPHGLDTFVGEGGTTLSGGQRQRLALGRAFLNPKALMLFDDCLSAVDVKTEETILRAMRATFQDAACLIVAHRPSSLRFCQRVFRLEDGLLVPVG